MKKKTVEVTERIIGKSGLSPDEKKAARYFYRLPTAGKKTKQWVDALDTRKFNKFLSNAQEKILRTLKGVGK